MKKREELNDTVVNGANGEILMDSIVRKFGHEHPHTITFINLIERGDVSINIHQ